MLIISVQNIINSRNIMHLYVASRWYYKLGEPLIDDETYDMCEDWVRKNNPESPYLKRSWEDDTEPSELIEMYSLPEFVFESNTEGLTKHLDNLLDNKSISIRPVHSYEDAYEWFKDMKGIELIFSLKVDGINTKTILNGKTLSQEVTSSRGRNTDNLKDYTFSVGKKLPNKLELDTRYVTDEVLPLYGEGYLTSSGIDAYEERFGKRFKTPRSGALSMLEVETDADLYNHLKVMFFRIEDYKNKMSESLLDLKILGLDVVPWGTAVFEGGSLEEFKEWIEPKLTELWDKAEEEGIPSDGVVVEINDRTEFKLRKQDEMYSEGNLALKIGPWKNSNYRATVEEIVVSSDRGAKENKGVLLRIKPITVKSGETITYISAYNIGRIIEKGILPGSDIEFTFVSDSIGVLV